ERPIRPVEYVDLSRIQPVGARVGYARIAKTKHTEASAKPFVRSWVASTTQRAWRLPILTAREKSQLSANPALHIQVFIKGPAKQRLRSYCASIAQIQSCPHRRN